MESFDEKTLFGLGCQVLRVECALGGLGALLRIAGNPESLSGDEIQGVGELIVMVKNEARKARRALVDRHHAPEFREFASEGDLKKGEEKQKKEKGETKNTGA